MKVVYSDKHRVHAPPYQLFSDGLHPASEVPERAECILAEIHDRKIGDVITPREFGLDTIFDVHDAGLLRFLEGAYTAWNAAGRATETGLIPDTFAMRTLKGKPEDLVRQAGYYCFETQTPIVAGTWEAACEAVWCALTAADLVLEGEQVVYALCRPPGHHAARDLYGGYCYLNNAAVAATRLAKSGRVTILDVDYHHGNGTQAIFYASEVVQFVSLHADPNSVYPFYSGYANEKGEGAGEGTTCNFPLPVGTNDHVYLNALDRALSVIADFGPEYLVVSLGVDIYVEDPLSTFFVSSDTFETIGRRLGAMNFSTLLVQEGGYNLDAIGNCVADVLEGVMTKG